LSSKSDIILIKYGGNAMKNPALQQDVIHAIANLHKSGKQVVLVHGGGPEIERLLKLAGVESEFVAGQRKTTAEAMVYVQMALRGEVNGTLVRLFNNAGVNAVGVSGKDGMMAVAEKRIQHVNLDGSVKTVDLGFVGNIIQINPLLIQTILNSGFLPVIAPVAMGLDGNDYNINADTFAGKMAAALKTDVYISLSDVDGLYKNYPDPESRISALTLEDLKKFLVESASGGMIPKLESIAEALEGGVREAHILNGTKPEALKAQLSGNSESGTKIFK